MAAQIAEQFQIALRQWCVGTYRHERRADIRQPVQRNFRVVCERAAQARRVHELQRRKQLQFRQLHFHRRDLLLVARIFVFANVAADVAGRNCFRRAIQEADLGTIRFSETQPRNDGREWHNANRQHRASGEMIEKRTLARFEPTEHRHVNAVAPTKQLAARGDLRLEIHQLQLVRQVGYAVKYAIYADHLSDVFVVAFVFGRVTGCLPVKIHTMFLRVGFKKFGGTYFHDLCS